MFEELFCKPVASSFAAFGGNEVKFRIRARNAVGWGKYGTEASGAHCSFIFLLFRQHYYHSKTLTRVADLLSNYSTVSHVAPTVQVVTVCATSPAKPQAQVMITAAPTKPLPRTCFFHFSCCSNHRSIA